MCQDCHRPQAPPPPVPGTACLHAQTWSTTSRHSCPLGKGLVHGSRPQSRPHVGAHRCTWAPGAQPWGPAAWPDPGAASAASPKPRGKAELLLCRPLPWLIQDVCVCRSGPGDRYPKGTLVPVVQRLRV